MTADETSSDSIDQLETISDTCQRIRRPARKVGETEAGQKKREGGDGRGATRSLHLARFMILF